MKRSDVCFGVVSVAMLFVLVASASAQKVKKAVAKPKTAIFAVLNDGKSLEPIAYVNKGKLEAAVQGDDSGAAIASFNKAFYNPGTVYKLIFGGADMGTATVKGSSSNSDCAKNLGVVTTKSDKVSLQGLVMALATNAPGNSKMKFFRRRPTNAEKETIEKLVRDAFATHKLTPDVLRYQNFTALDLNGDGTPEFVGSYWVEVDKMTRALLFFIADKGKDGKYKFGYQEFRSVDEAGVMGGDIKALDTGVYHEVLLDVFDYDNDGSSEVFSYKQLFEGAEFNVYKKMDGHWVKAFSASNYHCGY